MLTLVACAGAQSLPSAQGAGCSVTAEQPKYCACKRVTPADGTRYDKARCLDEDSSEQSTTRHNPWGIPLNPTSSTNEKLLVQEHYVINHDADLRVPTWVAYRLTADDLAHSLERRGCFRRDVRLSMTARPAATTRNPPASSRGTTGDIWYRVQTWFAAKPPW